jgi:hypothetical protein
LSGSPISDVVAGGLRELEIVWANEEERELELTATERYARDPIAWIEETPIWVASKFGEGGRVRPVKFRLFPSQRQTIEAWIDLEHLRDTGELRLRNFLSEKSRQIGETWGFAVILTWLLHFHRAQGLAMHRKGAEIDDGGQRSTVKSLFGKIRYIDLRLGSSNGLPEPRRRDQLPGLGRFAHRPFSRDPAKVENLDNGSVLFGEGQIDDPGRGATLDYALVDEAPFVEHGEKVHAALDEACPNGKAYIGTVNGDSNFHARLCDAKPKGYIYLRLHWSDHPIYNRGLHIAGEDPDCLLCIGTRAGLGWNPEEPRAHRYPGRLTSPWYDERVIGKTDEQVANELDIDRERALSGRVYSEFSTDVHVIADGIPYDPALEHKLELAWDFGLDATSVIVCQDAPAEYRVIGILEMGDLFGTSATPELVSDALRAYLVELGVDPGRVSPDWTKRIYGVGDPAGAARTLATNRPLVADYHRQGFQITKPPARLSRTVDQSIRAVKRLLLGTPKPLRVCGVKADAFARHMRNNTWPKDINGYRRPGSTTPLDDVHNHAARAFAYLILAKWGAPAEEHPLEGDHWDDTDPEQRGPANLERRRSGAMYPELDGGLDFGMTG